MTTQESPSPGEESPSIPDEVWERFQQDNLSTIDATAPKEPSARARMVARRLRERDEAEKRRSPAARRFGRRGRAAGVPKGWHTGPAWREMRRAERAPARRRIRLAGLLVLVAACVLAALNPSATLSAARNVAARLHLTGSSGGSGTAASQDGGLPAGAALATPRHPFAGSPAEHWADGAAGIVPPAARAVGGFSAAQVRTALAATKDYLAATNLDLAVLRGAYPKAAVAEFDPRNDDRSLLETALREIHTSGTLESWMTRYDPARLRLVGQTVRVRGTMSFVPGRDGSVRVNTDYTYVYPFIKADDGGSLIARVIVRRVVDVEFYDPPDSAPSAGAMWVITTQANIGDSACVNHTGYLNPSFDGGSGGAQTGASIDPYDRSQPMGTGRECLTLSRD